MEDMIELTAEGLPVLKKEIARGRTVTGVFTAFEDGYAFRYISVRLDVFCYPNAINEVRLRRCSLFLDDQLDMIPLHKKFFECMEDVLGDDITDQARHLHKMLWEL